MNIQKTANLAAVGKSRPQQSIAQLSTLLAVAEVSLSVPIAMIAAKNLAGLAQ